MAVQQGQGELMRRIRDFMKAWCLRYGPSWAEHGGKWPCIIAILMIFALPPLYVLALLDSAAVGGVTGFFSRFITVPPIEKPDAAYYWGLSGLVINTISIIAAMVTIVNTEQTRRFDRGMIGFYAVIIFFSLCFILTYRWTSPFVVWMLLFYYSVYVSTDLVGICRFRDKPYELAKYTYPFICLDFPALITAFVILRSHSDPKFAEGMAAGHLLVGSFCYFGMAGVVLPFALSRIRKAEDASAEAKMARMALPGGQTTALQHLAKVESALTI